MILYPAGPLHLRGGTRRELKKEVFQYYGKANKFPALICPEWVSFSKSVAKRKYNVHISLFYVHFLCKIQPKKGKGQLPLSYGFSLNHHFIFVLWLLVAMCSLKKEISTSIVSLCNKIFKPLLFLSKKKLFSFAYFTCYSWNFEKKWGFVLAKHG